MTEKLAAIQFGCRRDRHCTGFDKSPARAILPRLQGKETRTLRTVKHIIKSLRAGLGNSGDLFAFSPHGYQRRRRGEIAVPQIVFYRLKVPNALARLSIQR